MILAFFREIKMTNLFSGGAFNPLQVWEMIDAAKALWQDSIARGK
jgi:hypothetical protein